MKPIKWTKADERRSEKMGWRLLKCTADAYIRGSNEFIDTHMILRHGDHFKTDAEAVEFVVAIFGKDWPSDCLNRSDATTVRKAVLLCCGGGR